MKDELGNKLKSLEKEEDLNKLVDPRHFCYMRLDGKNFSKVTKNLKRPFDYNFSFTISNSALQTAIEFDADIVYTQSDEISLGWFKKNNPESQFIFGGKKQKLLSLVPSYMSYKFTEILPIQNKPTYFDARIVTTKSLSDFQSLFFWRYKDCKKNAIQQYARAYFSHRTLQDKNGKQIREMLDDNGFDFEGDVRYIAKHGYFSSRKSGWETLTKENFVKEFENASR